MSVRNVGTRYLANQLTNGQTLLTLLTGRSLSTGLMGGAVRVTGPRNFATVVAADMIAKNGVIYAIDRVLLP